MKRYGNSTRKIHVSSNICNISQCIKLSVKFVKTYRYVEGTDVADFSLTPSVRTSLTSRMQYSPLNHSMSPDNHCACQRSQGFYTRFRGFCFLTNKFGLRVVLRVTGRYLRKMMLAAYATASERQWRM
jgi:hypothetical protein